MFTDLSNDEVQTNKMLEAMDGNFPELALDNVFNLHNLHGIVSQTGLFAREARLFAPKDVQQMRRVHNGKFETDSLWNRVLDSGSLVNFDKEFQKDNVRILIVNPDFNPTDFTRYITGYYLPESRIVYFSGNPYAASDNKWVSLNEKWLYDVIKSKNINVERIVYSEAFIDNAPLFMSFVDFEKRILDADFSKYKK